MVSDLSTQLQNTTGNRQMGREWENNAQEFNAICYVLLNKICSSLVQYSVNEKVYTNTKILDLTKYNNSFQKQKTTTTTKTCILE